MSADPNVLPRDLTYGWRRKQFGETARTFQKRVMGPRVYRMR